MTLIYADRAAKHGPEFITALIAMCGRLGFPPEGANWLMCVMNNETVRTFSPSIRNPHNGAVGLIQFTETTARDLGTTTAHLATLTAVQQLMWVEKFYTKYNYHRYVRSAEDLYLATFYPAALLQRWPDGQVLGLEKGRAYALKIENQNPGMDGNGDQLLTVGEFKAHIRAKVFVGLKKK